jgi:hypothetical protein
MGTCYCSCYCSSDDIDSKHNDPKDYEDHVYFYEVFDQLERTLGRNKLVIGSQYVVNFKNILNENQISIHRSYVEKCCGLRRSNKLILKDYRYDYILYDHEQNKALFNRIKAYIDVVEFEVLEAIPIE